MALDALANRRPSSQSNTDKSEHYVGTIYSNEDIEEMAQKLGVEYLPQYRGFYTNLALALLVEWRELRKKDGTW